MLNNTSVENLSMRLCWRWKQPALGETFNIRDERLVTREEFIYTVAEYLGKPHPRHVPTRWPALWFDQSKDRPAPWWRRGLRSSLRP